MKRLLVVLAIPFVLGCTDNTGNITDQVKNERKKLTEQEGKLVQFIVKKERIGIDKLKKERDANGYVTIGYPPLLGSDITNVNPLTAPSEFNRNEFAAAKKYSGSGIFAVSGNINSIKLIDGQAVFEFYTPDKEIDPSFEGATGDNPVVAFVDDEKYAKSLKKDDGAALVCKGSHVNNRVLYLHSCEAANNLEDHMEKIIENNIDAVLNGENAEYPYSINNLFYLVKDYMKVLPKESKCYARNQSYVDCKKEIDNLL